MSLLSKRAQSLGKWEYQFTVIMNHIEAVLLLVEDSSAKHHLETAEAAFERMVHLLDIFSHPEAADESDLIGILEKNPSLFEKGVSTTGGGFGLYLSRKVVEGYEGSIELIPRNKGTAYRILLPAS
jgi:two-component sensor histidine kinase